MTSESNNDSFVNNLEINDAVASLLQTFSYDVVSQPSKADGKPASRVKRPMNPFMVFAQQMRRKLAEKGPQIHNAELSKQLGHMWRNLGENQKRPFIKESDRLRKQHKLDYPDYKYTPRRNVAKKLKAATRFKQEPSQERTHIDFSRINVDPTLLADGPPDGEEMDQYLKPSPRPEYHDMQPRFAAHAQFVSTPLYYHHCPEWSHYSSDSSGMP